MSLIRYQIPELSNWARFDRLASFTQFSAAMIATGRLPAHRVALLGPGDRNRWYAASPSYARALNRLALPAIRGAVGVDGALVLAGASLGALAALHATLTQPDTAGALFLQSGSFFRPDLDAQERSFGGFGAVTEFVESVEAADEAATALRIGMTCGAAEENLANNRRMVWVQVAMVFVTLYLATPTSPTKRKVKLAALATSPFIIAYLALGWDSAGSGLFKPVEMIRSVIDPQSDGSTMWREIENYDLLYTFRQYWILGTGYGNGYWEMAQVPAIDYALEKFIPHNSILGLWCYCGIIGYTAFTLLWAAGVFFAMRAYRAASNGMPRSSIRATALRYSTQWAIRSGETRSRMCSYSAAQPSQSERQ